MKAVILAGGEGTRLRPLTLEIPKPVAPVVDRPFLRHQLDLLDAIGVSDVVFSIAYRPEKIRAAFDTLRRDHPGLFDRIKEGTITGDRRVSLKAARTRQGRWDVEVFDVDEKTLKNLPGISQLVVNLEKYEALVEYDSTVVTYEAMAVALKDAGYSMGVAVD